MKRKFEDLTEITDRQTYDEVMAYLDEITDYATINGYLREMGSDNEYTREMGRIGNMCADYESIYMDLFPLKVKNPLIITIEKEMQKHHLNQRQTAELLEVKENTFSQVLSGKRNVSMQMAKKLYKKLSIDPKMILEFS